MTDFLYEIGENSEFMSSSMYAKNSTNENAQKEDFHLQTTISQVSTVKNELSLEGLKKNKYYALKLLAFNDYYPNGYPNKEILCKTLFDGMVALISQSINSGLFICFQRFEFYR